MKVPSCEASSQFNVTMIPIIYCLVQRPTLFNNLKFEVFSKMDITEANDFNFVCVTYHLKVTSTKKLFFAII